MLSLHYVWNIKYKVPKGKLMLNVYNDVKLFQIKLELLYNRLDQTTVLFFILLSVNL